ncbi:MAG: membrane dipeptidase [Bacteroidota bacterium]
MFIIDAHLDLSMNALEWNRDLRQSVADIRSREAHLTDKRDRGKGTVSLPALRKGNIGLVVATLIARYIHEDNPLPGWHSPHQAYAQTQGQLAWYRSMEQAGHLRQITNLPELEAHLLAWEADPGHCPIGYILSLEGADSMVDLSYVAQAWNQGLRAIGPAHYGPGTYAQGTDASGGIGQAGKNLLREMERLGMILDATHLCDESFWEAMDHFHGPVWASHSNSRAVVPHHRQFSDEQYQALIQRGAVIGMALDTWMMVPGWEKHVTTHEELPVYLHHMVHHIDHICQLAGNAEHVGMGTDLDGGFGREQSPLDVDTIADLQQVSALLKDRGYSEADIHGIMHGNWLRLLRRVWG